MRHAHVVVCSCSRTYLRLGQRRGQVVGEQRWRLLLGLVARRPRLVGPGATTAARATREARQAAQRRVRFRVAGGRKRQKLSPGDLLIGE